MRTQEYPVLSEEDEELIERLALGLGRAAARVLGYLVLREREPTFADTPATRLEIRVGTGESQRAVTEAVARLVERNIITETTIRRDIRGRPPKAWACDADVRETIRRVYAAHATALLKQAVAVAGKLGAERLRPDDIPMLDSADVTLTVGLNWHPNVLHAPLFAAIDANRYRERGVNVTLRPFEGSGDAVEALLTDDVDVTVAGAATTIRARAAGAPVVPLAPLFQRAMTVLYTTRSVFGERLERTEQLRGRRIGLSSNSEAGVLGRLFLSQLRLLDDATVVEVDGEERTALESGRADVVTGTFTDPQDLASEGLTVDVLSVADQFPIYGPTIVTTERVARTRPQAVLAFLAGTLAGYEAAVTDPERVVGTIGEGRSNATGRDAENLTDAVERFGPSGAVCDDGWGWQRFEEWQRLKTALDQAKLLTP
ncbi:ABC transporter substrate-binding protein [Halegenticoccus tardaugens]|uniref:ABC transporter substrate-binding protein n=1 Tax=Halegenticoccus tardaugens TaxID=2071624 RepID=UPI0013E91EDD|nr:ABC transporter substrate-binding protein [Halegenticoccus tardaugens]